MVAAEIDQHKLIKAYTNIGHCHGLLRSYEVPCAKRLRINFLEIRNLRAIDLALNIVSESNSLEQPLLITHNIFLSMR